MRPSSLPSYALFFFADFRHDRIRPHGDGPADHHEPFARGIAVSEGKTDKVECRQQLSDKRVDFGGIVSVTRPARFASYGDPVAVTSRCF